MRKTILLTLAFFLLSLLLTSCADVSQIKNYLPEEHTYGFWGGLWHGIIAPFAFIGELLFPDDIAVYAHNNNGRWYDFGFLLGIGAFASSSSSAYSISKS
jgi:hypothetical protein